MKTIEEQAFEYAPADNNLQYQCRLAYIKGATDQKAIDDEEYRKDMRYLATKREELIDKACEWLNDNGCFSYLQEDNQSIEDIENIFRDAMNNE